MLELLNIKEDNVEIQHLQNQLEKQKSHIEYLTNCNIENRTKIVELKVAYLKLLYLQVSIYFHKPKH